MVLFCLDVEKCIQKIILITSRKNIKKEPLFILPYHRLIQICQFYFFTFYYINK